MQLYQGTELKRNVVKWLHSAPSYVGVHTYLPLGFKGLPTFVMALMKM